MFSLIHRFYIDFLNNWFSNICFTAACIGVCIGGYYMTPIYGRKKKTKTAIRKIARLQRDYEQKKERHKEETQARAAIDEERIRKFKARQESKYSQPTALLEKWKYDRVLTFYVDRLSPYMRHLREALYYDKVITLLAHLDASTCASVVDFGLDTGERRSEFKKITLFDHSLNVAEEMLAEEVALISEEAVTGIGEIGRRIGTVLVCALGHDVGKIPTFFNIQNGQRPDHAYISYLGIEEVLKGFNKTDEKAIKNEIVKAIRDHHGNVIPGSLAHRLQTADKKAREKELKGSKGEGPVDGRKPEGAAPEITEDPVSEEKTPFPPVESPPAGSEPEINPLVASVIEQQPNIPAPLVESPAASVEQMKPSHVGINTTAEPSPAEKIVHSPVNEPIPTFSQPDANPSFAPPADHLVEDLSWLGLDVFLSEIETLINQVDAQSRFTTFSMPKGVVYVMPSQIIETVEKLACGRAVPEDKQKIPILVKDMLAGNGFVFGIENIRESHAGIRLKVIGLLGTRRGLFLPIVASAFKIPLAELEARKQDSPVLNTITRVVSSKH